jgi:hypothetical protein
MCLVLPHDGQIGSPRQFARIGIEDERRRVRMFEIKTAAKRTGEFIGRTSAQPAEFPIVFDKTKFTLAKGDRISKGSRGAYAHRPWIPASGAFEPHIPFLPNSYRPRELP